MEKNAGDEMNWLNWIPSGGTVIYCTESKQLPVKGVVITNKTELTELISLIHPQFLKFGDEARTRAIEFIARMNPYIHPVVQKKEGGDTIEKTYYAEKNKPILIPLYKFIAE